MKHLTKRALRVFAVLEDYREGSSDILDSIILFLIPILAEFHGKVFDARNFSARVRAENRWNFTSDVAEELIPRFVKRGLLEEISKTRNEASYRVLCPPQDSPEQRIIEKVAQISLQFSTFVQRISPLTAFNLSTEELGDILIEWLVSIDAYSEDVLRQKTNKITATDGRLEAVQELPDESPLSTDQRYLCARFAKHILQSDSSLVQDLCKIASVGLLTEVVQDFQKPLSRTAKTDLILYLDAPVALDLLGVSGTAAAENIRPLIEKIQDIGGTVRILRISVDELKRALDAVLDRPAPARIGPTADALRRNEVLEAYVREVARNPESVLQTQFKISVVERTLDAFPNQTEYFTKGEYEGLYSKLNWHIETNPRVHDVTAVTLIMRLRTGRSSPDIFEAKHLFVTRSGPLAQLARKFCIDTGLLPIRAVGPAVHQRQLAVAVWLRTGMSDTQEKVPKRMVLAACERVLALKRNVVDKVRNEAKNLTPEKEAQLELLLSQDRSVQVLMDKTLGVSTVINPANIESLVDVMKASLVEDIEQQKVAEVSAAKQEANKKIRKANERRSNAEKRADEARELLTKMRTDDREVVEILIRDVNKAIVRRRDIGVFGLAGAIVLLPFLSSLLFSKNATLAISFISLLVLAIMLAYQMLDKPVGFGRFYKSADHKTLISMAYKRGISKKLSSFKIDYDGHRY